MFALFKMKKKALNWGWLQRDGLKGLWAWITFNPRVHISVNFINEILLCYLTSTYNLEPNFGCACFDRDTSSEMYRCDSWSYQISGSNWKKLVQFDLLFTMSSHMTKLGKFELWANSGHLSNNLSRFMGLMTPKVLWRHVSLWLKIGQ